MSSSYRNSLNEWLSQLEVKADRVLDIGGAQETMPGRVKSWDVKEYLIADLPEPHKDSPKPDIELDLNEVPVFSDEMLGQVGEKVEPTTFMKFSGSIIETNFCDLIFCLEVFDYIYDPKTAFQNIFGLLKDGGTAWVSFPSVYPLHQPIEDDALRYMPGGIKKLAESVGFTVEEMIPRRFETDLWDTLIRNERMRAAKHEDHNFSGWIVRFTK